MSLFIQLEEKISDQHKELLSHCGFRWCTKDKRWESKRKLSPSDEQDLKDLGLVAVKYGKGQNG